MLKLHHRTRNKTGKLRNISAKGQVENKDNDS